MRTLTQAEAFVLGAHPGTNLNRFENPDEYQACVNLTQRGLMICEDRIDTLHFEATARGKLALRIHNVVSNAA